MKILRKKSKEKEKEKDHQQFIDGMKKVGNEYKRIMGDSIQGLIGK